MSSSDREVEIEMKKVQRSEDEEEWNGDTVVQNQDSSKEMLNEPATAGDSSSSHIYWNGTWTWN